MVSLFCFTGLASEFDVLGADPKTAINICNRLVDICLYYQINLKCIAFTSDSENVMTCMCKMLPKVKRNGKLVFPKITVFGDICHALNLIAQHWIEDPSNLQLKEDLAKVTNFFNNTKAKQYLRLKADPGLSHNRTS